MGYTAFTEKGLHYPGQGYDTDARMGPFTASGGGHPY